LFTGTYKVIDNKIYMSPSPVDRHQRISVHLTAQFFLFARQHDLGEVFAAPFDVYLDEKKNLVQPDLLFILKENAHIVQGHVHGSPDLIIEILSPSNKKRDLVTKKSLYEKFSVKEYWIIDRFRRTMTVIRSRPRRPQVSIVTEKESYTTPLLPGFELPLARLLAVADMLDTPPEI